MTKQKSNKGPQVANWVLIGLALVLVVVIARGVMSSPSEAEAEPTNTNTAKTDTQKKTNTNTAKPSGSQVELAAITADDHIRGNPDAPITIVEFSDTQCPFCKRFHGTMQQVMQTYGDDVRWVYKHAPLDSLHRKARAEAESSECVAELGGNDAFWTYIDLIFERTQSNDRLDHAILPDLAAEAGVDKQAFSDCLESGRHADLVQSQLQEAQRAGMRGTPYSVIIVDGETYPVSGAQPFSQVRAIIDPLL